MQAALDMIDFTIGLPRMRANLGNDLEDSATGAQSVYYDFEKEKWIIKARAIVFPVLILEIVKGMYEIIGLFGFDNLERGEKVVGYTDKIQNEPEDIAYGQMITKNLFDIINKLETNVTPEERDDFLQDIYKLSNNEFIKLMTNVINNRVDTSQMNQLKGMFKQMRQDKTADDADNALFERFKRIAGIIKEEENSEMSQSDDDNIKILHKGDILYPEYFKRPLKPTPKRNPEVGDMNEDGLYIMSFPQGYFFVEWDILKIYLKPGFVFVDNKDNHWEI